MGNIWNSTWIPILLMGPWGVIHSSLKLPSSLKCSRLDQAELWFWTSEPPFIYNLCQIFTSVSFGLKFCHQEKCQMVRMSQISWHSMSTLIYIYNEFYLILTVPVVYSIGTTPKLGGLKQPPIFISYNCVDFWTHLGCSCLSLSHAAPVRWLGLKQSEVSFELKIQDGFITHVISISQDD